MAIASGVLFADSYTVDSQSDRLIDAEVPIKALHLDRALFLHAKAKERGGRGFVDLITDPNSTRSLYQRRYHPINIVPAVFASRIAQRELPRGW